MAKFFIHTGMPRTGTTFLQQKVFSRIPGIACFSLPYTQYNRAFNKMMYADDSFYDPAEFKAEIDELKGEKVLLSNENFIGQSVYLNHLNRSAIAGRLHAAMPEAAIVLFIRNQPDILRSLYATTVGWKEVKTLNEFVRRSDFDYSVDDLAANKPIDDPGEGYFNPVDSHEHFDGYIYQLLIGLYKGLFENVHVLLFEDLLNTPMAVCEKLEAIFETSFPKEVRQEFEDGQRINKGIGATQAGRLRKLNKWYDLSQKSRLGERVYNKLKRNAMTEKSDKELEFSAEKRQQIKAFFAPHNQKLDEQHPELELQRYGKEYMLDD